MRAKYGLELGTGYEIARNAANIPLHTGLGYYYGTELGAGLGLDETAQRRIGTYGAVSAGLSSAGTFMDSLWKRREAKERNAYLQSLDYVNQPYDRYAYNSNLGGPLQGNYFERGGLTKYQDGNQVPPISEDELMGNYLTAQQYRKQLSDRLKALEEEQAYVKQVRQQIPQQAAKRVGNTRTRTRLPSGSFYCNTRSCEVLQDAGARVASRTRSVRNSGYYEPGDPMPIIPGNQSFMARAEDLGFQQVRTPESGDLVQYLHYPSMVPRHSVIYKQRGARPGTHDVFSDPGEGTGYYLRDDAQIPQDIKVWRYVGQTPQLEAQYAQLQREAAPYINRPMPDAPTLPTRYPSEIPTYFNNITPAEQEPAIVLPDPVQVGNEVMYRVSTNPKRPLFPEERRSGLIRDFNIPNPRLASNKEGGLIKRADGSYSKRGLWDNIRDNIGSGRKPTKEMLEQERKIKAKMQPGGKVTHQMAAETPDGNNWVVFPTVDYNSKDKTWIKFEDPWQAYDYHAENNSLLNVPSEELAMYYAQEGLIPHGGKVNPRLKSMSEKLSKQNKSIGWIDRGLNPQDYPALQGSEFDTMPTGASVKQKLEEGGSVRNGTTKRSTRQGKKMAVYMDGTWHHFGDSSMDDYRTHKSEKRREAFYSRHKKNLQGDSSRAKAFRVYARKTWQDGGMAPESPVIDSSVPITPITKVDPNTALTRRDDPSVIDAAQYGMMRMITGRSEPPSAALMRRGWTHPVPLIAADVILDPANAIPFMGQGKLITKIPKVINRVYRAMDLGDNISDGVDVTVKSGQQRRYNRGDSYKMGGYNPDIKPCYKCGGKVKMQEGGEVDFYDSEPEQLYIDHVGDQDTSFTREVGPEDAYKPLETYAPMITPTNPNAPKGGSIAVTHNNPGNIKFGKFAQSLGAEPGRPATDGGIFAVFPNLETGLAAQRRLLTSANYRNLTVNAAMKRWSNSGYGGEIYPSIANKRMSDLTESELKELQRRQIKREDGNMYRAIYGQ